MYVPRDVPPIERGDEDEEEPSPEPQRQLLDGEEMEQDRKRLKSPGKFKYSKPHRRRLVASGLYCAWSQRNVSEMQ